MWCKIFIVYFKDEGCSLSTNVTARSPWHAKLAAHLRAESVLSSKRIRVNVKVTTIH
jgi:hypothetical protein